MRKLKAEKADKATIDVEVAVLLQLKNQLRVAQGQGEVSKPKKNGKK